MTIPAAVAVPLTAPALTLGPAFGILTLLGLAAVTLAFGVLIVRLAGGSPAGGAPRDTSTPDARGRSGALLREAA